MILGIEGEEIATAVARLVFAPADRYTLQVTQQESANAAVGDDGDVTHGFGHSDDLIDCPHNLRCASMAHSQPRMLSLGRAKNSSAVASNSALGKKPVDERSFSPRAPTTIGLSPRRSAKISTASIAFRSALENSDRTEATQGRCAAACILRMPTGDSGQSGTWMVGSMTTSGWVMK
jgi:hypothetical protein